MRKLGLAVILALAILPGSAPVRAEEQPGLAGRWALNRGLSQLSQDIGFGLAGAPSEAPSSGPAGRGGGGRRRSSSAGSGVAGTFSHPESEDDATRARALTEEARNPSDRLTIAETPTAVTIADDRGVSRTFHPDGKEDVLQLDGVPVPVTAKRDAGRLVVVYSVEEGRQLRYTYSRTANPPQLVVEVRFIEPGESDTVTRIYEVASATEAVRNTPAAAAAPSASVDIPQTPAQAANLQPGAEFKGLTKLGVVVEALSPQAAACGLSQGALETAISTRVTDAGFGILKNSDEDTYLYINVMTTSLPSGLCVSRYDAFLYSHTSGKLPYGQTPVLVDVSLLHKGGLGGSAPTAHAADVLRGVQEYVDQFLAQIRAANK